MLKYENIFKIKYTEAILSNNTWKLLWFEITEMLIAVIKIEFIVLFIIIFGTVSFAVDIDTTCRYRLHFPADITASFDFAKLRFHFLHESNSVYKYDKISRISIICSVFLLKFD